MTGLFAALAATAALEIVELFSGGAVLAATIYTAAKTGKKPSNSRRKR